MFGFVITLVQKRTDIKNEAHAILAPEMFNLKDVLTDIGLTQLQAQHLVFPILLKYHNIFNLYLGWFKYAIAATL